MTAPDAQPLHATCVAIGEHGVLLTGRPGAGKSDLALRLIDRGARLVSDDATVLTGGSRRPLARAPATTRGRLEVRGLGIVALEAVDGVPVVLVVDLDGPGDRMPDGEQRRTVAGTPLALLRLDPREPSAPIKVELALRRAIGPA